MFESSSRWGHVRFRQVLGHVYAGQRGRRVRLDGRQRSGLTQHAFARGPNAALMEAPKVGLTAPVRTVQRVAEGHRDDRDQKSQNG